MNPLYWVLGAIAGWFTWKHYYPSAPAAANSTPPTLSTPFGTVTGSGGTVPAGATVYFPGSPIGTPVLVNSPAAGFPVGTIIDFGGGKGTGTIGAGGVIQ